MTHDSEGEKVSPPPESDVERFLSAHAEHESIRSLRDSAVWFVAMSSVGVAFVAEWSDLVTVSTHNGLLALWALPFSALFVLTIFELRLRRRLARQIAAVERRRQDES